MNYELTNHIEGALAVAMDSSALFEQYDPLPTANDPIYGPMEEAAPEYDNLYLTPL
ncbi:MAG: hypothetical protein OXE83_04230 [Gammaproteobacteria bacterium]|nr:hypothetical protein [Gammaproteobacteria bacterium]